MTNRLDDGSGSGGGGGGTAAAIECRLSEYQWNDETAAGEVKERQRRTVVQYILYINIYVTVGRIKGSLVLLIFKPSAVVRASSQLVPSCCCFCFRALLYCHHDTAAVHRMKRTKTLCPVFACEWKEEEEEGVTRFFYVWCHQSVHAMADVWRLIKCWWDRSTDRPLRNTIGVSIVNYC